jgi:hypothetical protein
VGQRERSRSRARARATERERDRQRDREFVGGFFFVAVVPHEIQAYLHISCTRYSSYDRAQACTDSHFCVCVCYGCGCVGVCSCVGVGVRARVCVCVCRKPMSAKFLTSLASCGREKKESVMKPYVDKFLSPAPAAVGAERAQTATLTSSATPPHTSSWGVVPPPHPTTLSFAQTSWGGIPDVWLDCTLSARTRGEGAK